jgi:hypothetical protein
LEAARIIILMKRLSNIWLDLRIDTDESLSKVNNFEAIEISSEIGKITFSGDKTVKVYLNLWYSSAEEKKLMIVEFTFKNGARNKTKERICF